MTRVFLLQIDVGRLIGVAAARDAGSVVSSLLGDVFSPADALWGAAAGGSQPEVHSCHAQLSG